MDIKTLHTPESHLPFQVTEGVFDGFMPGGLPTPDWAFSINPTGPDQANDLADINEMNQWFGPDIDVVMFEFSGGDPMVMCEHIQAGLLENSEEAVECWNGSLLAFWKMPGGGHIIMAADNGGDCDVQQRLEELASKSERHGRMLSRSHFSLKVFFDPQSYHYKETESRELLGDLLASRSAAVPLFGATKIRP